MVRLLGLGLLLIVSAAYAAEDLYLVRDGKPVAQIVVGPGASGQAKEAAGELQAYLRRMSGAELPVVEQPTGTAAPILVGQAAAHVYGALGLTIPSGLKYDLNDEGYVVATVGGKLVLAGNETEPYQGTYYAVTDLLESLGCRWYFPGDFGEVVPQLPTIRVAPVRKTVRPDFRVRDTWYSGHLAQTPQQSADFQLWKRRNRMTRSILWANCNDPEAKFLQNPVDDSTYRLLPKERYWTAHPEYYAMMPGGGRNERFLCMSSPGALQAATDTVVEQFRARPDHHTFAFSPPDEPVLCHCPDCTRAMHGGYGGEGNGDVSDAYFGFVFRLADAVAQRAPNHWITTMAYYNRCRPPEGVEGKRANLLIQLASIQQCTIHSYADPHCWSRQDYAAMLRRWQEFSAGQVFYEYDPHDWSHSQRPGWRSQSIAEDLRLLKQGGGWGFSNEGQMAWLATGLNYYVRARLAWDLSQDPQALVQDFCHRFFGPAREPMQRYHMTVEQALRNCPSHFFAVGDSGAHDAIPVLFPPALRRQCEQLLTEAARQAAAEPYATRVKAFRLHFDRLNDFAQAHEAMARGDYAQAAKLADAMVQTVKDVNNTMLLQDAGPWGGVCSGAGLGDFARKIAAWTSGDKGRLLLALPASASFRSDPASEGLIRRWYLPGDPREWQTIALTCSWDHSGVATAEGHPYHGIGWYRVTLDWDAKQSGPVGMCVPDLRGSALWLWTNGQLAGYLAASNDDPTLDLTGRLRPGHNELVFRVDGSGGFGLPPFLFRPGPGRLTEVPVFPGEWLFRTDAGARGQQEGWQRPELDDAGWRSLPVPAEWGTTSVGRYEGTAWYRVRFKIPAELSGRRFVLHFGAVDEEAWVYLNGQLVGEHSAASTGRTVHQIWDQPFDVPLPNARVGAENLLAVRVANSMLAGGIYKPVQLCVTAPTP